MTSQGDLLLTPYDVYRRALSEAESICVAARDRSDAEFSRAREAAWTEYLKSCPEA